jgi:N-acetylglucosamine malate deacetylase 1
VADAEKLTVLGIGAHPSDPFACTGGALAKHARRGDRVIVLSLTHGLQHLSDKLIGKSLDEIRGIVMDLTTEAAELMGIQEVRYLGWEDTPLRATRERILELGEAIREIRPDIVSDSHHPGYGYDHGEAARMVELAPSGLSHGDRTGRPPHHVKLMYHSGIDVMYPLLQPLRVLPDTYVDVTETIELKVKAYAEIFMRYSSVDKEKAARHLRSAHEFYGLACGADYAEPYYSIRPRPAVPYLGG